MASAVLPVPVLGRGGLDGDDGNESDSHGEEEDNEGETKKAAFVRCPLCRNSKEMCESCKKRQNREASRRNREKHARTKAELERMRSRMTTLKAQHREDRNFIQTMLLAGVRFCHRCGSDLMNMPTPSVSNIPYANAQQATGGFGLHHSAMPQTSGQPGPHHDTPLSGNAPLANVTFPSSIDDADFFDMEAWLNADDDAYN